MQHCWVYLLASVHFYTADKIYEIANTKFDGYTHSLQPKYISIGNEIEGKIGFAAMRNWSECHLWLLSLNSAIIMNYFIAAF